MTDQPKKTSSSFNELQLQAGNSGRNPLHRFRYLFKNVQTFIPLLSGILLIITGLILVSISILGFIPPFWISGMLSLLGSTSSMVGVFLIYQTVTSPGSFDSLINKAIRRVVNNQN